MPGTASQFRSPPARLFAAGAGLSLDTYKPSLMLAKQDTSSAIKLIFFCVCGHAFVHIVVVCVELAYSCVHLWVQKVVKKGSRRGSRRGLGRLG